MMSHYPDAVRQSFVELWELVIEPFSGAEPYDWGASDLPQRVTNKIARAALSRYFRVPPREIVFLHRRLAGVFIMLATLRARISALALLERFDPSAS